jgi:hypothetical protein
MKDRFISDFRNESRAPKRVYLAQAATWQVRHPALKDHNFNLNLKVGPRTRKPPRGVAPGADMRKARCCELRVRGPQAQAAGSLSACSSRPSGPRPHCDWQVLGS